MAYESKQDVDLTPHAPCYSIHLFHALVMLENVFSAPEVALSGVLLIDNVTSIGAFVPYGTWPQSDSHEFSQENDTTFKPLTLTQKRFAPSCAAYHQVSQVLKYNLVKIKWALRKQCKSYWGFSKTNLRSCAT